MEAHNTVRVHREDTGEKKKKRLPSDRITYGVSRGSTQHSSSPSRGCEDATFPRQVLCSHHPRNPVPAFPIFGPPFIYPTT